MNAVGFVCAVWSQIAYILGVASGAREVDRAGGCYGY